MSNIIEVKNLKKVFKVSNREKDGFGAAVKSLFKREYKLISAVDNVNLSVEKGEIRGLIGPNGAGKSTTIKMLCGVLYPTSGEVNVMGFTPWLSREKYVKNIGVVFGQKTQLWWDLPPIDSFSLNKKMYNIPDDVYNQNISKFKEILKISDVITRPTRQLSLGERMKCELVCAMLHEPELIFLDEPTIGLDIVAKDVIREFIKTVNMEKKTTFILTTHDLADIENLCENVTIINKGTVVYDDSLMRLKRYFSNKKIVEVSFKQKVDDIIFEGFKVIERTPVSASIEVELDNSDIQTELQNIIKKMPIDDINVNDIPIDEVIKQIYNA